jgi:DNA helicase II / ATP-dependent DNA helicase PcrA
LDGRDDFDDETAAWWKAEKAWVAWLSSREGVVTHLASATGNTPHTAAPMLAHGGRRLRAPDVEVKSEGRSTYWEVKYRTRPAVDPTTGKSEHWMAFDAFADYLEVDRHAAPVHVALFEAATATRPGRWLEAHIDDLRESGREELRAGRDGREVRAWVWPTSAMSTVAGPRDPDVDRLSEPVLTDEGPTGSQSVTLDDLVPAERTVRRTRRARADAHEGVDPVSSHSPVERAVGDDASTGLDILSRALGMPTRPEYSVLRLGAEGCDVDDLLGLLDYGIRVFLVTGPDPDGGIEGRGRSHFAEARLLEWVEFDEEPATTGWVVDGDPEALARPGVEQVLERADSAGAMNVGQYRIVHAPIDSDVLVTAGAGTGKTETMSERLVFVLSTGGSRSDTEGRPTDLRPSDIALITFTNDAAREIRARLSKTLTLRRRLCPMAVQPLSWLLGIGSMQVSTIHAFAKAILQRHGAVLGLSPSFAVRQHIVTFRRFVQEELSSHLSRLFDEPSDSDVAPAHAWVKHIERIWATLGSNGIDLFEWDAADVDQLSDVDWGGPGLDEFDSDVAGAVQAILHQLAERYTEMCKREDTLPTDALVPAAIAALERTTKPVGPASLFVDEFQDTDPLQMRLLMALRERAGTRLFAVGDAKQGIYRFRGAEGDAFRQLKERFREAGLSPLVEHGLTWNFRTEQPLLDSLHPHFAQWGDAGLLSYHGSDRLRPAIRDAGGVGAELDLRYVRPHGDVSAAVGQVTDWRRKYPKADIAVLCRINKHAIDVHRELRSRGEPSELVVGGDFFRTQAVLDLRTFLEAAIAPHDDAALLELTETRWASGVLGNRPAPFGGTEDEWPKAALLRPWQQRLAESPVPVTLARDDLDSLRRRVAWLRDASTRSSTLEWLIECAREFAPHTCPLPSDAGLDRDRYQRCLDHAITLLDDALGDSPVTLDRVLAWLKLKIDTDSSEDEPIETEQLAGRTTALTVHKAKGLEFDLVLVPYTWLGFGPHGGIETATAVLRRPDERPRLAWKWAPKGARTSTSNVSGGEEHLWALDSHETAKEEARLLYVALTRAKSRAVAFIGSGQGSGTPRSWSDLLRTAGRP